MVKDVYERYLRRVNLANLLSQEDTAAERPQWVYYILLFYANGAYIPSRRGLALLILGKGNARAYTWDKRKAPTSFHF